LAPHLVLPLLLLFRPAAYPLTLHLIQPLLQVTEKVTAPVPALDAGAHWCLHQHPMLHLLELLTLPALAGVA
jgi:hypothetical protein